MNQFAKVDTEGATAALSPEERQEIKKLAGMCFQAEQILEEPFDERLLQQHLFMFRVALKFMGRSKEQLRDDINRMADEGTLAEAHRAIEAAGAFFEGASGICDAAASRMIVCGCANLMEDAN